MPITKLTVNADVTNVDWKTWYPTPSGYHYSCVDETIEYGNGQDISDYLTKPQWIPPSTYGAVEHCGKIDISSLPGNASIEACRIGAFITAGAPSVGQGTVDFLLHLNAGYYPLLSFFSEIRF